MSLDRFEPTDGALLIDKPPGFTSHDVVNVIRRKLDMKRVGHCGTLDPSATGLLIIVTGKGTKLSERLMGDDKVYDGSIKFGETTDSYDADGNIVDTMPIPPLSVEELNETAAQLTGDMMQTPPMVSAVKVGGKPLYKYARKGIEVERKARLIHVYHFKIFEYEAPEAEFAVTCTKGTYIRSLAHELGQLVGCGAHLTELRRTESGRFDLDEATPLEDLREMSRDQAIDRIIPITKLQGRLR